jgi:hypothetical protein
MRTNKQTRAPSMEPVEKVLYRLSRYELVVIDIIRSPDRYKDAKISSDD